MYLLATYDTGDDGNEERADDLLPISLGESYTLLRTRSTINGLLRQISEDMGRNNSKEAIRQRKNAYFEEIQRKVETNGLFSQLDQNGVYRTDESAFYDWMDDIVRDAKDDACGERLQEIEDTYEQCCEAFLRSLGLDDLTGKQKEDSYDDDYYETHETSGDPHNVNYSLCQELFLGEYTF